MIYRNLSPDSLNEAPSDEEHQLLEALFEKRRALGTRVSDLLETLIKSEMERESGEKL